MTEHSSCDSFDSDQRLHVAIIGSGSGAFAAAIRAADSGARVTLIESADVIGGTCVNVGCVPSKIQIRAAQLAQYQRKNPFAGLTNSEPSIDRGRVAAQQRSRVAELRQAKYQNILSEYPAITLLRGFARFDNDGALIIALRSGGEQRLTADRVLIATGASAMIPSIPGLTETPYWTSDQAVFCEQAPEHLIIIGASVVAVEQAQAFRRLGSKVTILARSTVLSCEDPALGKGLTEALRGEGIAIWEHTQAKEVRFESQRFIVKTDAGSFQADRVLVATGRAANTANLGLASIGVDTDEHGRIKVDEYLQTSARNVYATGDCTDLPQFVYVAAAAGTHAATNMVGGKASLDLSIVPAVIFTEPQVATVGLNENQALAMGLGIETRTLSLNHVPRALANFDTQGFVKIVAEAGGHRLLGVQVLAPEAGEIIQVAAIALLHGMTATSMGEMLFPYLTYAEALKLCAQTFSKDIAKLSCCAG